MSSPIRDGVIDGAASARLDARLAEQVGWIRQAAGPRFEALELSVVASMLVTDDRRRDAQSSRKVAAGTVSQPTPCSKCRRC
jgi:hypothetical protein